MASSATHPERSLIRRPRNGRRQVSPPTDIDIAGLKRALQGAISGEVRFDAGSRAMYANDFSNYRAVPIGVVIPRGAEDVVAGIAACREYGAPVLPRGCGTAPSGQTTNVAVVFDYSKYFNQILELDPESGRARVEPGVICDPAPRRRRAPPPTAPTRPRTSTARSEACSATTPAAPTR